MKEKRFSFGILLVTLSAVTLRVHGIYSECPEIRPLDHTPLLQHESDCTKFYMCDGKRKVLMDCPYNVGGGRLHFNPKLQVCDYPERAACTVGLPTEHEGRNNQTGEIHVNSTSIDDTTISQINESENKTDSNDSSEVTPGNEVSEDPTKGGPTGGPNSVLTTGITSSGAITSEVPANLSSTSEITTISKSDSNNNLEDLTSIPTEDTSVKLEGSITTENRLVTQNILLVAEKIPDLLVQRDNLNASTDKTVSSQLLLDTVKTVAGETILPEITTQFQNPTILLHDESEEVNFSTEDSTEISSSSDLITEVSTILPKDVAEDNTAETTVSAGSITDREISTDSTSDGDKIIPEVSTDSIESSEETVSTSHSPMTELSTELKDETTATTEVSTQFSLSLNEDKALPTETSTNNDLITITRSSLLNETTNSLLDETTLLDESSTENILSTNTGLTTETNVITDNIPTEFTTQFKTTLVETAPEIEASTTERYVKATDLPSEATIGTTLNNQESTSHIPIEFTTETSSLPNESTDYDMSVNTTPKEFSTTETTNSNKVVDIETTTENVFTDQTTLRHEPLTEITTEMNSERTEDNSIEDSTQIFIDSTTSQKTTLLPNNLTDTDLSTPTTPGEYLTETVTTLETNTVTDKVTTQMSTQIPIGTTLPPQTTTILNVITDEATMPIETSTINEKLTETTSIIENNTVEITTSHVPFETTSKPQVSIESSTVNQTTDSTTEYGQTELPTEKYTVMETTTNLPVTNNYTIDTTLNMENSSDIRTTTLPAIITTNTIVTADYEGNTVLPTSNLTKCLDFNVNLRLPHETNCSLFYICDHSNGIIRECPAGLHFNKRIQVCDWPESAGCNSSYVESTSESTTAPDPRNHLLLNCPGKHSAKSLLLPHECICQNYYLCRREEKVLRRCPNGTHFNFAVQKCVAGSECESDYDSDGNQPFECIDGIKLPHEDECSLYYSCRNGIRSLERCSTGLLFDSIKESCDYENNVDCQYRHHHRPNDHHDHHDHHHRPNHDHHNRPTTNHYRTSTTGKPVSTTRKPCTSKMTTPRSTKPTSTQKDILESTTTVHPETTSSKQVVTTNITTIRHSTTTSLPDCTKITDINGKVSCLTDIPTTNRPTTELPRSTAELPRTTTELPRSTAELPRTTTELPRTTTELPRTTTELPRSTTELPRATTELPRTTTELPRTTTELPRSTTELPRTTTELPRSTTELPRTTTELPRSTTELPRTTTELPRSTTGNPNLISSTVESSLASTVNPNNTIDETTVTTAVIANTTEKSEDTTIRQNVTSTNATPNLTTIRPTNPTSNNSTTVGPSSTVKPGAIPSECPLDSTETILIPHETDCHLFYTCDNGFKVLQECPAGLYFNPVKQYCDWPENVDCKMTESTYGTETRNGSEYDVPFAANQTDCPKDNFGLAVHLPHEYNCSLFYKCNYGAKVLMNCQYPLYFNPVIQVCDYQENVNCTMADDKYTVDKQKEHITSIRYNQSLEDVEMYNRRRRAFVTNQRFTNK